MKYRTKLYLFLVGVVLISYFVGFGIMYSKVKEYLFNEIQSNAMSIASSTAANLNIPALTKIELNSKDETQDYTTIQNQLHAILLANRRQEIYLKYIYLLVPQKSNPERFFFLVDAESAPITFYNKEATEGYDIHLDKHLLEVYSPEKFIEDEWGTWLSGYAPVYNQNGKYIATVGVNIEAKEVNLSLHRIFEVSLLAFCISLVFALVIGFVLSKRATMSLNILKNGVKLIAGGEFNKPITINTHDEFNELAQEVNKMAKGLDERERLKLNFSRYVSQSVMELMLKSDGDFKLEGERRKVTMLFSDIRQFTKLSESLHPEQVVALLNEYFEVMVDVVFKYKGMLDKFLGDGMMVEFGAPLKDDEQEFHAVQAAIEMQLELKKLCDRWEVEGNPRIEIGIGIHSGESVVGNIGSEKHIEYTAIGDTVNVASRLQDLTKELKSSIVVSESVALAVIDKIAFKKVGPVMLRGRVDPIIVYVLQ